MPARHAAMTLAATLLAVGCVEPAPTLAAGARRPFICTAEDTNLAQWRRERAWRSNPDALPMGRGTAFAVDAWRSSDGRTLNSGLVTLGVHFVNGSSAQKALVRRLVPEWTEGAVGRRLKLRFDAPRDRSDIRIRFDASGDSSEVGRQALKIPKERATMTLKVTDRRAVLHEFGHALGLKHEHLHPRNGRSASRHPRQTAWRV